MPDKMRLQKYLAQANIASRRKAEEFIKQGKVKVNDKIITEMGYMINPEVDKVHFENLPIAPESKLIYYALNKPVGYTTTAYDPHAEHNILELVPTFPRVFPVGRLDKNTSGLIILTNDGYLAHQLTHPKFEHEKEYIVKAEPIGERPTDTQIRISIDKLTAGIELEDGKTAPAKIASLRIDKFISFHITIHEGRKRQIRRMLQSIGLQALELKRIRISNLILNDIPPGEYRIIAKLDIINHN
jgi:23S rRNA pseudouridine2605 synthase